MLETEELGIVVEIGTEVEARRAMDTTEVKYNSLCFVRSPDNRLQIFCAEFDAAEVNFLVCPRSCLRKRVDVELRLYSSADVWKIIDCKKVETGWSTVVEEADEVCVFV